MECGKFEPFDKVLVRNDVNEAWTIGLFEMEMPDGSFLCLNRVYKYCISYKDNKDLLGTTYDAVEDLAIDEPVMCNCGADNRWHLFYYAGHGEVWMYGAKSTDHVGKCAWYNIVPYDEFNPKNIEVSMTHNISENEGKEGGD